MIKTLNVITEFEFKQRMKEVLIDLNVKSVTGPGRSGALSAVYASYLLELPFIPFKLLIPEQIQPLLIIDSVRYSGSTLRKARKFYEKNNIDVVTKFLYDEPPRLHFWFEFQH